MSLVLNPSAPCFMLPSAAKLVDVVEKAKQTTRSKNYSKLVNALTYKLPHKPPPVDFGIYDDPAASYNGLSPAFDTQKPPASVSTLSKEVKKPWRKRRVLTPKVIPGYTQSTEAAKLLPKIPLRKNLRWTSRSKIEEEALVRIKQGAEFHQFAESPFLPKSLKDFFQIKQGLVEDNKKYIEHLIEKQTPKGPRLTVPCMGGRTFETNRGAVLSMHTIWCPQTWLDTQENARWPCLGELRTEGCDRQKSDYGRFFPVPRSEDFEQKLCNACKAGMTHKDFKPWGGEGECPFQQRRFAPMRSGLDIVWGMGREMDAEEIYGRPQEIDDEDKEGLVGKALMMELQA